MSVYYTVTLSYPGARTTNSKGTLAAAVDCADEMAHRHFGVDLTEDQRVVLATTGWVQAATKRESPLNFYFDLYVVRNEISDPPSTYTSGPAETLRADHERWQTAALRSITSGRVTWVRWEKGAQRISHPTVWTWVDEEGYERCHATRRDAVAAIIDRYRV